MHSVHHNDWNKLFTGVSLWGGITCRQQKSDTVTETLQKTTKARAEPGSFWWHHCSSVCFQRPGLINSFCGFQQKNFSITELKLKVIMHWKKKNKTTTIGGVLTGEMSWCELGHFRDFMRNTEAELKHQCWVFRRDGGRCWGLQLRQMPPWKPKDKAANIMQLTATSANSHNKLINTHSTKMEKYYEQTDKNDTYRRRGL